MSETVNINEVPLSQAVEETGLWQAEGMQGQPPKKIAWRFDRGDFDHLLDEPGAAYIRIYPAMNDEREVTLTAVAVDAEGNDMIGTEENSGVYDFTCPCPNTCDVNSPLNHDGAK